MSTSTTAPQFTNISLRMTVEQAEFVREWARAAGRTVSDAGGELLLLWASSDLGRPAPQVPRPQRSSRPPSAITVAAQQRGMSRDEYRQWAAKLVAEADVGAGSGERLAAPRVPMIAIRPPTPLPAPNAGRYSQAGKGGR